MTYKIQIDDVVRDATDDERIAIETLQKQPTLNDRANAILSLKQSARQKLKMLGLTDDEIGALVG